MAIAERKIKITIPGDFDISTDFVPLYIVQFEM